MTPQTVWLVALEQDYEGKHMVRGFINEEAAMAYAQHVSEVQEAPLLVLDLATEDDIRQWSAQSNRVAVWSDDGDISDITDAQGVMGLRPSDSKAG